MIFVEWGACIAVVVSLFFNPKDNLGNVILRTLNLIGSILYIIFALDLEKVSMVVLNSIAAIVNLYYLIKGLKGTT